MDRVVGTLWIFRWVFQWWKSLGAWLPSHSATLRLGREKEEGWVLLPFYSSGPKDHKGPWSSVVTGKICLLWLMKGRVGWQQQFCYDWLGSSNAGECSTSFFFHCSVIPSNCFLIASSTEALCDWFIVVNIEGMGEGRTHGSLASGLQSFLPCFHCLAR